MTANLNLALSDAQLISLLSPFDVRPSSDRLLQIREYLRLLRKWNQTLNLTSIRDPAEMVSRHFGESMFAASKMPVEKGRLAALGTGAGFPGLALKIICPELHVYLIESNNKKCAFLAEVVRALSLKGVDILPKRFEQVKLESSSFDLVTARALGGFSQILGWAKTALKERGHALLWLGGEDTTRISKATGWMWQSAIRIPESQQRYLLIGRPDPISIRNVPRGTFSKTIRAAI